MVWKEKGKIFLLASTFLFLAEQAQAFVLRNPLQVNSIEEIIAAISNYIFYISIVGAPLGILIGAFMILFSAGDPGKVDKGRKIILWTVVGFAIILFSRGILSVIKSVLAI